MEYTFFSLDSDVERSLQSQFVTELDAYEILEPLPTQQPEENYIEMNESGNDLPKTNYGVEAGNCPDSQYNVIKCVECGLVVQRERSFAYKNALICAKCSAYHNPEILAFEEPDKEGRHKKCSRCRKLKHITYFVGPKGKILQTCQKCLLSRSRKYFMWKKERNESKRLV